MNIIIVNGYPEVGKTTFENFCLAKKPGEKISSIDYVKEVAKYLGWNGEKTPKDRAFLSNLKRILTEWNEVPLQEVLKKISEIERKWEIERMSTKELFIFVDVREPEEIEKYKRVMEDLGWKVHTVLITNEEKAGNFSNTSDANVLEYSYEYIVVNEKRKGLDALEKSAEDFIDYVIKQ